MPDDLLKKFAHHFTEQAPPGQILDLASGSCRNGIFLAQKGLKVICCDTSAEALESAKKAAHEQGVDIDIWQVDLERESINPLPEDFFAGIIAFRYLHRPLIPCIKKALKPSGILIYETFTIDQPKFGKPHNPMFLLKPGELLSWFADWEIIHHFEGIIQNPNRAAAQIVCKKEAFGTQNSELRMIKTLEALFLDLQYLGFLVPFVAKNTDTFTVTLR